MKILKQFQVRDPQYDSLFNRFKCLHQEGLKRAQTFYKGSGRYSYDNNSLLSA